MVSAGVTVIETSAGGVTVKEADGLVTARCLAVTAAVPAASVVTLPPESMPTRPAGFASQTTVLVRFAVDPFEYVPVARTRPVKPSATLVSAGVTAIETRTGGVTVKDAGGLVTLLREAVSVAVPVAIVVTVPLESMATTPGGVACHVARAVRFAIDPFEYVPVARTRPVKPIATLVSAGATAIEISAAGVTVKLAAGLVTLPSVARIPVVPGASVVAKPVADRLTTPADVVCHDALDVRFAVDPFE